MRRRMTFIVLGLVGALAACGSTGTAKTTTTLSTAQLETKLLDVAGVGTGWQLGQPINDADRHDATQLPCEGVTLDPAIAQRLTPATGVQFEPTDQSYKHLIEFALSTEPKQLDADLRTYFTALEQCSKSTATTPGASGVTITKLTIPKLGDQQAAYTYAGKESVDAEATWYSRGATVRVGSIAVQIGLTEILSSSQPQPQISDDAFVHVLQTAVNKVKN